MNTNGHYDVRYYKDGARRGQVQAIACKYCRVYEIPSLYHKGGDKSGQGRYNRARAVIVKHLHAAHRDELARIAGKE